MYRYVSMYIFIVVLMYALRIHRSVSMYPLIGPRGFAVAWNSLVVHTPPPIPLWMFGSVHDCERASSHRVCLDDRGMVGYLALSSFAVTWARLHSHAQLSRHHDWIVEAIVDVLAFFH